jgi:NADPH:quinone reductase-like Zn-dependent oxidoreductase
MKTMKAVRIHKYGGPDTLIYEDAPMPVLTGDDILVRIHASGVNPVDWKAREGHLQGFIDYKLPFIPGWDFSGVVEAVGENATGFEVGQEVYSRPDISRDGTYAEYIAARASEVAKKPTALSHIEAAAVPLAALTAWQSLFDAAHLVAGQTALIHAAAGGVGVFAIQLAKWKGAKVIGTASKANHKFLRDLGADEVIDYKSVRFEDVVKGVDVVFDTIAGETQERSWQTLKPGGTLVSVLSPPSEEKAAQFGAKAAYVFVQPNSGQLTRIAELIDEGNLKVFIEKVFPLDQARQAQELNEQGHTRGKIVLSVM